MHSKQGTKKEDLKRRPGEQHRALVPGQSNDKRTTWQRQKLPRKVSGRAVSLKDPYNLASAPGGLPLDASKAQNMLMVCTETSYQGKRLSRVILGHKVQKHWFSKSKVKGGHYNRFLR